MAKSGKPLPETIYFPIETSGFNPGFSPVSPTFAKRIDLGAVFAERHQFGKTPEIDPARKYAGFAENTCHPPRETANHRLHLPFGTAGVAPPPGPPGASAAPSRNYRVLAAKRPDCPAIQHERVR
jgi:hypothetical protein